MTEIIPHYNPFTDKKAISSTDASSMTVAWQNSVKPG